MTEYKDICVRIIEIEKTLHLRMDSIKKEIDILERFHSFIEEQAYIIQLIKQKIEK